MVKRNNEERSISRRLPSGTQRRGLKSHVKLVGEVVWAWNDLHRNYALAFAWALDSERSWVGQAIWSAVSNDGIQRDIFFSLLDFCKEPQAAKRLRWAIEQTRKLASYRNDVVHGAMLWTLTEKGEIPSFDYVGNPPRRILRYLNRETEVGEIIEGPNLQKLMTVLRGDLMQLSEYVLELGRILGGGRALKPLPRRPRLKAEDFALAWQKKIYGPRHGKRRARRA